MLSRSPHRPWKAAAARAVLSSRQVFFRSEGSTRPSTDRSRTTPEGCMYRNSPRTLPLPVMDRPEMVWPCPSKVPPKVGMGVKSVPDRSISASRRTILPWDQLSRVQFSASWTRSSAVRTKPCPRLRRPGQQAPPGTPAAPPPEGSSGIYESSVSWAGSSSF